MLVAVVGVVLLSFHVITLFWLEIVVTLLFAVFWMMQTIERPPPRSIDSDVWASNRGMHPNGRAAGDPGRAVRPGPWRSLYPDPAPPPGWTVGG